MELGQLGHLRAGTVRRIATALSINLAVEPRWRGGELGRLSDAGHAKLVEQCIAVLRRRGWLVDVEFTFNVYGERGSVDVIAWRADAKALLVIEVKTIILDLQGLLSSLDRKVRLVPPLLAAERRWRAEMVGKLVVAPASTRNRAAVDRHEAMLAAAFPGRGADVRRWLRDPDGPIAAIWLTRPEIERAPRRSGTGASRVFHARSTRGTTGRA